MKEIFYIVKVPIPNTENYTETKIKSREKVCEFLGISNTAFYAMINKTVKYSHKRNSHLEGIIIEKIETITEVVDESTKIKKEIFLNNLIEKINCSNKELNSVVTK